jgi:hypothetical protein
MSGQHARLAGALVAAVVAATAVCSRVSAAPDAAAPASSASEDVAQTLPPLPKPPSAKLGPAKPKDTAWLDALLKRLEAPDYSERDGAVREILEIRPDLVSAIGARLDAIASQADANERDAMKKMLEKIRRHARNDVRETMRAAGQRGKVQTPDYLDMLVKYAEPKSKPWQDLVSVVAMTRMLVQIGTVQAAREVVREYVHFGEFLRADTQLQLQKMGGEGVAALIEARRYPAKKVQHWADRELDMLGKALPGEAVQTTNYQALADILRAYGRARDPDAARLVVSFANIERAQVRLAARQAVVLMGDVADWQLRDAYEDIIGQKPPRDWSWRRTARELFNAFDRQRLARVYKLFDAGMSDYRAGKLEPMRDKFNQVLAQNPMFDRRPEMTPGYVAFAAKFAATHRSEAIDALRRALRLTENGDAKKPIESQLLTLEGERLLVRGVADQTLFQRAIELDPSNRAARDALGRIEHGRINRDTRARRFWAAGAIGLAALVAITFIGLRRRGDAEGAPETARDEPTPGEPPEDQPSRDEPASHEPAPPESPKDEPSQRELAPEDEPARDAPGSDKPSPDESR